MSGVVVWFTGLPSSGKSTLAAAVRERALRHGLTPCLLDGDVVRRLVLPQLGYSEHDRTAFYEALAQLAAELARQGLLVLVAATAHRRAYRRRARQLAERFLEVWVTTPLEECRQRDSKGLYAASDDGSRLPGAGVLYEEPEHADMRAGGADDEPAIQLLFDRIRAGA